MLQKKKNEKEEIIKIISEIDEILGTRTNVRKKVNSYDIKCSLLGMVAGVMIPITYNNINPNLSAENKETLIYSCVLLGAVLGFSVNHLADLKDKYGFDITYFDDSATMYQDVKTGNTVACFEDQPVMSYGVSQANGLEIVAEEKDNFSTPYGFAVLKGQNADLLKMFNEGLKNIKANGTYDEIVAKYTSAK